MRNIYVPASGLDAWQARLADPEVHWKRGRSAFELAVSWELATRSEGGLPPQVSEVLDCHPQLQKASVLFALPEHQVRLDGKGKASQTDLWALLRNEQGLISLAVEGKAGEPFDKTVEAWLGESENRRVRLAGLCQILELPQDRITKLRYQLLHRAASAVLEARRCGAANAVLLIQSFGQGGTGYSDFQDFCSAMDVVDQRGRIVSVPQFASTSLWLGWMDCPCATDDDIVKAAMRPSERP